MEVQQVFFGAIASLVITMICGFIIIPFLRRLKLGQNVRDDGPKRHLKKSGTPTMGGIIMLIAITAVGIYYANDNKLVLAAIFLTLSCAAIGFIDDYLNVILKRSMGLTALQKMCALIFAAVVFTMYIYNFTDIDSKIIIPFFKDYQFDLGALYISFTVFVILCATNSINLTDGLDGLASGITCIVSIFFTIAGLILGNIPAAIFSAVICGSCLGFLYFNIYPAKVFMGDTGSLALGGAVAAIAIILKMPLFLVIVGGVYVLEALSVIIQVISFKISCKRVFKMAPIHHHFELSGWRENKVVVVFWTAAGILNIIGLMALL